MNSDKVRIDLSTAYEEAQAETQHWRNRALIHAEQARKFRLAIVKGGDVLEEVRAKLIEQMGGQEAIAALMQSQAPAAEKPEAKD